MKSILFVCYIFIAGATTVFGQGVALDWVKQIGGTGSDEGFSITIDNLGSVYVTGRFYGTVDFDPGTTVYDLTAGGTTSDVFVVKLNNTGEFVWAKQFGGADASEGYSITVSNSGNVYVTGKFNGTVDFDPGTGNYDLTAIGTTSDIFVSKLDNSGDFVWAKQFEGSGTDEGRSIVVDNSDNVYTTGIFEGVVDFDPGIGTFSLSASMMKDLFISKLDSDGNFLFAKRIGRSYGFETSLSIAVDNSGSIYATGGFDGTVDFDPGTGTHNLTAIGNFDAFLVKLDAAGDFIWVKQFGGVGSSNQGHSIETDGLGNVYVTGAFTGVTDFNPSSNVLELNSNGSFDVFILKLDLSGNLIWVKQHGGTFYDYGLSLAVDSSNNVYTTGYFQGTTDFDPDDTGVFELSSHSSSGYDIFVSKLDSDGNFVWAKHMGGTGSDVANAVAVDDLENVYMTGYFASDWADFDPGSGTNYLFTDGSRDVFISKLSVCSQAIDSTVSVNGITLIANEENALYRWFDCSDMSTPLVGETGQSYTATQNGIYAVEVTINGCYKLSDCISITTVGFEKLKQDLLTVYPNPVNDKLFIKVSEDLSIQLIDVFGATIQNQYLKSGDNFVDMSLFARGIYFVLTSNGATLKIVKE